MDNEKLFGKTLLPERNQSSSAWLTSMELAMTLPATSPDTSSERRGCIGLAHVNWPVTKKMQDASSLARERRAEASAWYRASWGDRLPSFFPIES